MNITVDNEQQHFVVVSGNSVSCLEFQMVYEQACELARRIKARSEGTLLAKGLAYLRNLVAPNKGEIGTVEQYSMYQTMLAGYSKLDDNATWFDARTPAEVQQILEDARNSGDIMRVFVGDVQTGRDWLDEYDTIGRIGRSSDWMKLPQVVPNGQSEGPALLSECIVRIFNVTKGTEVYRHPTYHTPKMELAEAASYDQADGYTHCVKMQCKDGNMESSCNFKSHAAASDWLAFMDGQTHDYPVGN
jgi:hypothetical protein